jgi:hypothetical protein
LARLLEMLRALQHTRASSIVHPLISRSVWSPSMSRRKTPACPRAKVLFCSMSRWYCQSNAGNDLLLPRFSSSSVLLQIQFAAMCHARRGTDIPFFSVLIRINRSGSEALAGWKVRPTGFLALGAWAVWDAQQAHVRPKSVFRVVRIRPIKFYPISRKSYFLANSKKKLSSSVPNVIHGSICTKTKKERHWAI